MITKVKNRHLKTFEKEFGREGKNIFIEALGDVKLEDEVKKLKREGKSIDTLSCDEFKQRFGKFTGYEIKRIREIEDKLNRIKNILLNKKEIQKLRQPELTEAVWEYNYLGDKK